MILKKKLFSYEQLFFCLASLSKLDFSAYFFSSLPNTLFLRSRNLMIPQLNSRVYLCKSIYRIMDIQDLYYLGKITKLHSFKGELVFYFDVDDINDYRNLEMVLVDYQEAIVPFIIQQIHFNRNNSAVVRLMDVETEEEALKLVNASLYLPISSLPPLTGKKFYYHEVIGFEVIDQKDGFVGKVVSINDAGARPLFEIKDGYQEILLPVVDHFIVEIDRQNKKLQVQFPDGLLDIYRGTDEDNDEE